MVNGYKLSCFEKCFSLKRKMRTENIVIGAIILIYGISSTIGHGMMLDPPGRSSRWRYNTSAPINRHDDGVRCGGMWVQFNNKNNGKCGVCGDQYDLQIPRPNELGGTYGGKGVITKVFSVGEVVTVNYRINLNHLGYIYYDLCNLDTYGSETEDCFKRLNFTNGMDRFQVTQNIRGDLKHELMLPKNVKCLHCVLRWTNIGADKTGKCTNGNRAKGCGPQEQFHSCSDVSILPNCDENCSKET